MNDIQIGFSRVITDYAVFAFILDVFIVDQYQGRTLGKQLMEVTMNHPDLQAIYFWSLVTKDAHGLYQKFGFTQLDNPELWMQFDKRSKWGTRDFPSYPDRLFYD